MVDANSLSAVRPDTVRQSISDLSPFLSDKWISVSSVMVEDETNIYLCCIKKEGGPRKTTPNHKNFTVIMRHTALVLT